MSERLILGLPSKGRLMEQCAHMLAQAGLSSPNRARHAATRARSRIAWRRSQFRVVFRDRADLKTGTAHLGITGEDLLRETIADCNERVRS